MSYIFVNSFKQGLDARRSKISAQQGSLYSGKNIHINRGGEIEKRKAFVSKFTLPAGTFGLHGTRYGIYTFGSKAATTFTSPAIPIGIIYQQLIAPFTAPATVAPEMTEVVSVDTYNGVPYVVARFADGSVYHFFNGVRVTDWDAIVSSSTDMSSFGQALSDMVTLDADVNSSFSTIGGVPTLTISKASAGTFTLAATVANASGGTTNTVSIVSVVAGSSTVAQVSKVQLLGATVPADVGDTWTVTVNGRAYALKMSAAGIGSAVRTYRDKVYATVQGLLYFCDTQNPARWKTSYTTGTAPNVITHNTFAGFESLSSQTGQSDTLVALAPYQNALAVFSRRATQIWRVVAGDPVDNTPMQFLDNIGTMAPRSAVNFGELDVFFLSDTGIRSLRARDASNAAVVFDVGTSIDPLVIAQLKAENEVTAAKAVGVIEPREGRYLLAFGNTVYVYSFFPASNISAWTTYEPGFAISDWAIQTNQLYCRSGNTIYLYGGDSGDVYDNSPAEVELSWFDADKPAHRKRFHGLDLSCEGTWTIQYSTDPVSNQFVTAGYVTGQNFSLPAFGIAGYGTHIGVKLSSNDTTATKLSSAAIHFEFTEPPK